MMMVSIRPPAKGRPVLEGGIELAESKKGLEDVEVLTTRVSYIDGLQGVLEYRGQDIGKLVEMDYETVSHLLLYGHLPDGSERDAFRERVRAARPIDEEVVGCLKWCNPNIDAMHALRTAVAYAAHCDPDLHDNSLAANLRKGTGLIAKFPTIVAAFKMIGEGRDIVQPDPRLAHGANLLYMLRGSRPTELEAEIMEKDLILSAEHELNPSTFSARVTASTLSDLHSSVISGINTLIGPLHGGARTKAMLYFDAIGSPDEAEQQVLDILARGERVMGFGHRVYKTYDPRARIYKELARRIAEKRPDRPWFAIAEAMERTVQRELVERRGKPLYPNVDFYSAVMYKYLDLDPALATSLFAISRVSGWIAHVMEQYADNRLIRPRAVSIRQ